MTHDCKRAAGSTEAEGLMQALNVACVTLAKTFESDRHAMIRLFDAQLRLFEDQKLLKKDPKCLAMTFRVSS